MPSRSRSAREVGSGEQITVRYSEAKMWGHYTANGPAKMDFMFGDEIHRRRCQEFRQGVPKRRGYFTVDKGLAVTKDCYLRNKSGRENYARETHGRPVNHELSECKQKAGGLRGGDI